MKRVLITAFILSITMEACMTLQKKYIVHIDWKVAATLPVPTGATQQPGVAGTCVGITNNVMIVAGGSNFPDSMPWLGGKKRYYDNIYVFERTAEGKIRAVRKLFHLPFFIGYGASATVGDGVVCAGGENEDGLSNTVLMIKWDGNNKDLIFRQLPGLPFAISNAVMTAVDNKLYLAGGDKADGVSDSFFVLDTKNENAGWVELAPVPQPFSNAVMVSLDNGNEKKIYLIGGRKKNKDSLSTLYSSVYQYTIQNNAWQKMQPLPYALSAGTGLATSVNSIVLFGGDKGETFQKTEALIVAINAEKDLAKKQQLIVQKTELQQSHPGFSREVLWYDGSANSWKAINKFPFETQVTTMAVQWGKDFVIPGGEIRAGVRTPNVVVGHPSF